MTAADTLEKTVLDRIEPQLVRDGFRVVRNPQRQDLPAFLNGYVPDAVALGSEKSIAIEIKSNRQAAPEIKVAELQKLFAGQRDWELRFIYFAPDQPLLVAVSQADLTKRTREIRSLIKADPQAAFVMAWAVLESSMRNSGFERLHALSPQAAVSLLASEGYLEQDQVSYFLAMADLRNRIIHGNIDLLPLSRDVHSVLGLAMDLWPENDG